jgi:hypothetical protein
MVGVVIVKRIESLKLTKSWTIVMLVMGKDMFIATMKKGTMRFKNVMNVISLNPIKMQGNIIETWGFQNFLTKKKFSEGRGKKNETYYSNVR